MGGRLALPILRGDSLSEQSLVVLPFVVAGEVVHPLDIVLVLLDTT